MLVILSLPTAGVLALQPTTVSGTTTGVVSATTVTGGDTIPPIAPPGRGIANENDNVTIVDTFSESGASTLPIESPPDNILSTQIQNELFRQIPSYTASTHQISSQSGFVTIQGSVRTEADSRQIVNVIKRIPGVKAVRNNLTVESPGNPR